MSTEINISKLNQTNYGTDFSANDNAERLIITAFCSKYDVHDNGGTVGFVPEYDWTLNKTLIEIKMSKNRDLFIEVAKADGTASGLEVTTSDIHMFINPASVKLNNEWVDMMKLRLIRTNELKAWINFMAHRCENDIVVFEPSSLGKGSAGWFLNLQNHPGPDIEDMYMMGFEYYKNEAGEIIMDTQKIIMPDSTYAASSLHRFIE